MNKKKLIAALAVWALTVALTLIVFFTVFSSRGQLRVTGLVFLLVAECVALAVFIVSDVLGKRAEKVMFNAASYTLTLGFLLLTFIITISFMVVNKGLKWLALLDNTLIILYCICFIVLLYISNALRLRNNQTANSIAKMKRLETIYMVLKSNQANAMHAEKLNKLYEYAKYCDQSITCETDQQISDETSILEEVLYKIAANEAENKAELQEKAAKNIEALLLLFKKRTEEAKIAQSGGF